MHLRSVVFPHPLGPSSTSDSPAATVNDMSLTGTTDSRLLRWNDLVTPRTSIAGAEAATVGQTAAQRTAAIQAAIQNAIIPTGYDPRVVLAALRAVDFCPTGTGDYSGEPLSVPCGSLKDTLSAEAQAAIQNVETTVVALIDNSPTPAALGGAGPAAIAGPGAPGGGGGYIQSL